MNLPDFLRQDDLGEILFTSHRVTLYHVVRCYQEGCRPETIVDQFPTLPLAVAYKAVAYYLENREQVDRYVESTRREIERQAALPPKGPSFDDLKQRLDLIRQAESA